MQQGSSDWTSEISPYDEDVKGTISERTRFGTNAEERKYFIEDAQKEAAERFKTGAGIVKDVASFTPAGDAIDAIDFYNAATNGDGYGMALSGIGFIPLIGNYIKGYGKAKRLKKISNALDGEIDMKSGVKMTKENKYPWYDKKSEKEKLNFYNREMERELRSRREYNMLYNDGALGEGRLIHQRNRIDGDVIEPIKRSRNNNEAYKNKGVVENAVWWRKEYPFYDFNDKMDIISISEEGIPYKHVKNHFDKYTVTTDAIPINNAKDVKIYKRAINGEIIPEEHMRRLQQGGSDWTSEINSFDPDVNNTITITEPAKRQKERFKKNSEHDSVERFKKGADIVWTALRYVPGPTGLIANSVELAKAIDEKDNTQIFTNLLSVAPLLGYGLKAKSMIDANRYINSPGIKLLKFKNADDLSNEFGRKSAEEIIKYGNHINNGANIGSNAYEDIIGQNKSTLDWIGEKINKNKYKNGGKVKKRFDNSEKRFLNLIREVSLR